MWFGNSRWHRGLEVTYSGLDTTYVVWKQSRDPFPYLVMIKFGYYLCGLETVGCNCTGMER